MRAIASFPTFKILQSSRSICFDVDLFRKIHWMYCIGRGSAVLLALLVIVDKPFRRGLRAVSRTTSLVFALETSSRPVPDVHRQISRVARLPISYGVMWSSLLLHIK